MKTTFGWLLSLVASLVMATLCRGDALPESGAGASADDAAGLIEQLDAPQFARRQEASRKLTEAGKAAFPEIEKAAQDGSREVASRALEVLRSHFQGGDQDTKQAARAALSRLAASGNPAAAQRAKDILDPPPEPQLANLGAMNPAILQLARQRAMRQAQIQMQMRAPVGGPGQGLVVRRTSVRTTNGQREIEVQEGDKITKVRDLPGGGIEGQITEKVNGKETTRKVEAKDLDDLKKKDAELAKVYEQYQPRPVTPDTVKRQIESLDRVLERMKADLPNNPARQRTIDSLERTRQQYEQRLKDAEKQAAARPAR